MGLPTPKQGATHPQAHEGIDMVDNAGFTKVYMEGGEAWSALSMSVRKRVENLMGEATEEERNAERIVTGATKKLEEAQVEAARLRRRAKDLRLQAETMAREG